MRKYMAIASTMFKAQIVYRFDVGLTALATFWRVMFAWILWGAIFTERETVSGFNFQAMLSYYVVSSFLVSIDLSEGISGEVSRRIRGGTFTKFMVIPSNPQLHFLAQSFGTSAYYALFAATTAVMCSMLFRVELSFTTDPMAILCALVMIPLGLAFMISYHYFIGILAFKFQNIGFFLHVQGSVLSFFTGAIVPLSLLPQELLSALRFMPFTYVAYTPAMLLTGQAAVGEGFMGLVVLASWAAAMFGIGQFTYKRLRVIYDGVGI